MTDQAKTDIIIKILDLAAIYGVVLVKNGVEAQNKEVITREDIEDLKIDDDPSKWWDLDQE